MQPKGRPRVVSHSPASLQLCERHQGNGACVLGPILSLWAPAARLPIRSDQLELSWQEQTDGTPTHLAFQPPNRQSSPSPCSWSLLIPMEQLLLAADRRKLAEQLMVDGPGPLDTAGPASCLLGGTIHRLREMADQGLSHGWLDLEPLILERLVDALMASPGRSLPRQDRGWRHVIETLRSMDQCLGKELTLADLARVTGVTPRSLQMAFRRHLQKRPLQSLRELRLARLRRLLLLPGRRPGMAEALRHCGLPGNGTTARHYQERFAEKPSQTRP
jgi:AraC-like DNA-binding protein